jgi:hypothetical protein
VCAKFISGNRPTGVLMDQHHHQGRMQLLRLRGDERFCSFTTTSRGLYSVTVEQAVSGNSNGSINIYIDCDHPFTLQL